MTEPASRSAANDLLAAAVADTIAANAATVERWCANEPGAWGFLAGQGVLAYRERLGRRLQDSERRELWARLWAHLEALRATRPG